MFGEYGDRSRAVLHLRRIFLRLGLKLKGMREVCLYFIFETNQSVEAASDPRKTSHPGPPRPPRPRIARQASLSIDDLSKTMRQEDKTPATDLLTVPRPPSIESSARMSRSSLSLRRTTLPPNLDPKSYFAELRSFFAASNTGF